MDDTLSPDEIKSQLQEMDPYEFEKLVAKIWDLQGYQTTVSKGSGDRAIDVEASKETPVPQKVLIQAKRYSEGNKVGADKVRKYATLYQQVPDADTVVIVTTSRFTREASQIAQEQNVKAINIDSLVELLEDAPNVVEEYLDSTEGPLDDLFSLDDDEGESDLFDDSGIKDSGVEELDEKHQERMTKVDEWGFTLPNEIEEKLNTIWSNKGDKALVITAGSSENQCIVHYRSEGFISKTRYALLSFNQEGVPKDLEHYRDLSDQLKTDNFEFDITQSSNVMWIKDNKDSFGLEGAVIGQAMDHPPIESVSLKIENITNLYK